MQRVALLGTGLLGSGFAEGLLTRGGVELAVWNRTRAKADALAAKGARVADSPADAVRGADRVHLILLDDDTVDATIDALLPALERGAVIFDHTTNVPARTAARARSLSESGIDYLHTPVFMSPAAAREAKGMMMVAGPRALFDRVRAWIEPMSGSIWYVGERPDLAAAYKLFGNAMLISASAAVADVFHMADALDVPRTEAFALFDHFKTEPGMLMRARRIIDEDFVASFTLETARKDIRLMREAGDGQPMPIVDAIAARMDDVIARGMGNLDMAVMAKRGV